MTNENQKPLKDESQPNEERFESDTQRIVHRHLENKDDVITDEDIRNIRVGMVPATVDGLAGELENEDVSNDSKEDDNEELDPLSNPRDKTDDKE